MPSFAELKKAAWGDYTKSPEEKKLVRKLDFYILTYCCVSFFFNYLDRAAFANAYVSGLKEDLNLQGNEYNILLSLTTAGYLVGQYPHSIIIHKIAPRIWFPSMVVIWAGLTMASAACHTYQQLCVVRFFQGLIEASTYCGTLYIVGSWYKPEEIAKRTGIFTASGQCGSMFAGVMMTAIKKTLDGHGGLPGWRWVFIIDGLITLPIAIFGFLSFPDTPELTKAPWLSPEEIALALARLPPKKPNAHNINFKSTCRRVLLNPTFYIFNIFSAVCAALEAFCVQGLMLLYLSNKKYPSSVTTTYPLAISAVGIVSNLSAAVWIDATGKRFGMGCLAVGLQLICAIILLIPTAPVAALFVAFYLAGTSYIVNPLLFGWANVVLQRSGDDVVRSVTLYSMNAAASLLYTWWGIVFFPATDAPYWKKGAISMICICAALFGLLFVVQWTDDKSLAAHKADLAAEESAKASVEYPSDTMEKLDMEDPDADKESTKVSVQPAAAAVGQVSYTM